MNLTPANERANTNSSNGESRLTTDHPAMQLQEPADAASGRPRRVGSYDADDDMATLDKCDDSHDDPHEALETILRAQPQVMESASSAIRSFAPSQSDSPRTPVSVSVDATGSPSPRQPQRQRPNRQKKPKREQSLPKSTEASAVPAANVTDNKTAQPKRVQSVPETTSADTAQSTASGVDTDQPDLAETIHRRRHNRPKSQRKHKKLSDASRRQQQRERRQQQNERYPVRHSPKRSKSDSLRQISHSRAVASSSILEHCEQHNGINGVPQRLSALGNGSHDNWDNDFDDMPPLIPICAQLMEEHLRETAANESTSSVSEPTSLRERRVRRANSSMAFMASTRSTRTTGSTSSSSVSVSSSSTSVSTSSTDNPPPPPTHANNRTNNILPRGSRHRRRSAATRQPKSTSALLPPVHPMQSHNRPPSNRDSPPMPARKAPESPTESPEQPPKPSSTSRLLQVRQQSLRDMRTYENDDVCDAERRPLSTMKLVSDTKHEDKGSGGSRAPSRTLGPKRRSKRMLRSTSESRLEAGAVPSHRSSPRTSARKDVSDPTRSASTSDSAPTSKSFLRMMGRVPPQSQTSLGSKSVRKPPGRTKSDKPPMSRGIDRLHPSNTVKRETQFGKLFSMSGLRKSFSLSKGKKQQQQQQSSEVTPSIGTLTNSTAAEVDVKNDYQTQHHASLASGLESWIKHPPAGKPVRSDHSRTQRTETTLSTISTGNQSDSTDTSVPMGRFVEENQANPPITPVASNDGKQRRSREPSLSSMPTDLPPSPLLNHLERYREGNATSTREELEEDDTIISDTPLKMPLRRSRSSSSEGRSLSPRPRQDSADSPETGRVVRDSRGRNSERGAKGVWFDSVTIREYERCIGDSPAVSSGPPIGLDWGYYEGDEYDVDYFESQVRRPGPRTRRDFFLSPQKRFHILLDEWGFSVHEICRAKDEAAEIRHQRHISAAAPTSMSPQQCGRHPSSTSDGRSKNRDVPPTTIRRRTIDTGLTIPSRAPDDAPAPAPSQGQDRWNPCPSPVPA